VVPESRHPNSAYSAWNKPKNRPAYFYTFHLYYGSYIKPRELLWCSGVILLFLMMGTAFSGYVLPWGQMSF